MDSQKLTTTERNLEPPSPSAVLYFVSLLNPPSPFKIPFQIFKFSETGGLVSAQVLAPDGRDTTSILQTARSLRVIASDYDDHNMVANVVLSKQDFLNLQRAEKNSYISKRPRAKHDPPTYTCGLGLRRLKIMSACAASHVFLGCCWLFFVKVLGWHLDLWSCWLFFVEGTWMAFLI